jgi:hypothetical protein
VGLINPINARKRDDGYEINAGERRWRARPVLRKTIAGELTTRDIDSLRKRRRNSD